MMGRIVRKLTERQLVDNRRRAQLRCSVFTPVMVLYAG